LIGRSVALDAPCRQCGSATAIIRSAPPPHAAALHCVDCGTHRQWIARSDYAATREFAVELAASFGDLGAISFRGAIQRQDNQEATDMQERMRSTIQTRAFCSGTITNNATSTPTIAAK
jgi:hypothetical protein